MPSVLNAYSGQEDIAGGFGLVYVRLHTHKDFGSGDRICYHGVMDMFRNRKLAGYLYAAQQEDYPVLELSSSMDIGEHPAGLIGNIYAITNADSVRMYKNDRFVAEFDRSPYETMPHGPILIDDFVGNQLVEDGAVPEYAAPTVKELLLAANRYGLQTLPRRYWSRCSSVRKQFGITETDFMALYGRYIGNWGQKVPRYRFEAVKDGKVVSVITRQPMKQCTASAESLPYQS